MNVYEITRWFGVAFFLILVLALIVIPVRAETQRPNQGDLVAVGSTVDITGVMGFSEGMAYYGYSGDTESDPLYVLEMPDRKRDYYQFYLDPAIFGQRLGPWYQFVGNNTGVEHGNLLMFRVVKELPKVNVTNVTTPTPTPTPIPLVVGTKPFSTDYQIAYGDSLVLPVNTKLPPPRLWVFGRLDKIYNKTFTKQQALLTKEEVQNLEVGEYTVIAQFPGKNTIFEVGYSKIVDVANSKTTEQLTSPWVATKPVDIYGSQPSIVLVNFMKMISATDDVIVTYRLEVANPIIDIASIDETYSEGKDVLDIRGYTNVAKDTPIVVLMDADIQTVRTFNTSLHMTVVEENTQNTWRYFQIYLPIDYETITVGQHEITTSSPQGAKQTVPFYVYDLPKGQVTPNETIKYVAGNIFVAPVTVTITIPVPGPTQTILVPVTPSNEQVYAQQKIVLDKKQTEKDAEDFKWRVIGLVGVIVVICILYGIRVVKKARLR